MKKNYKKRKNTRKTGKNSWLRSRKKNFSAPINALDRQKLAGTITGEIFQPMRLHYKVSNSEDFLTCLTKLKCIDHDSQKNRWVWLYLGESLSLDFAQGIDENNPIILGEFIRKESTKIVLNVRSFERGSQAIEFFDQYIPRKSAKLTHVTICNKLFPIKQAFSIESLDHYFEQTETLVRNPEKITQDILELTSGIDSQQERSEVASQYIDKLKNEPILELEQFPVYFYEEGIEQVKMQLNFCKAVAYQHWLGNTNYTTMDAIHDALSGQKM